MFSLLVMHACSLSRDRYFHRVILVCIAILVSLMLVITNYLMQHEWPAANQGNILYEILTLVLFSLLITLQPYGVQREMLTLEPYAYWQRQFYQSLIPVFNTLILMLVCLPMYALAAYTGGVRVHTFMIAGGLILAAVVFMVQIQLNWPHHLGGGLGFAQAALLSLSVAPFVLVHLPRYPQWLLSVTRTISVPWTLADLFSSAPSSGWLVTCLVYLLAATLLWVRSLATSPAIRE